MRAAIRYAANYLWRSAVPRHAIASLACSAALAAAMMLTLGCKPATPESPARSPDPEESQDTASTPTPHPEAAAPRPSFQPTASEAGEPTPEQTLDQHSADPSDLDTMLRWVAQNYKSWDRVSDNLAWSPYLCMYIPPQTTILASRSSDEATHGRKLYYLYARDHRYLYSNPAMDGALRLPNPVGQVLVKEGWQPVDRPELQPDSNGFLPFPEGVDLSHVAQLGDRWYVRGEQADLYIMYRLARNTPGTDAGWLYAVVSPNPDGFGPQVLTSGLIESCIDCHRESTHDRILGMWPPPTQPTP